MSTERAAVYTFGPRFFHEGDQLMFEFTIDHGSKIGPRVATEADKAKHAEAFNALGEPKPEPKVTDTGQPRDPPRRPPWPPKRDKK